MIKFSEFRNMKKKFVGLFLDDESQSRMEMWCLENGFDLTKNYDRQLTNKFVFHTTIFFTSNEIRYPTGEEEIDPIKITFTGIDLFGQDKNIPVLKIEPNSDLKMLRDFFEHEGFEDTWPSWKPHMSVSYNYDGQDLSNLKLPFFDVLATKLKVENQK